MKFVLGGLAALALVAPTTASGEPLPPRAHASAEAAALLIEAGWGPAPLSVTAPSHCPRGGRGWLCRFRIPRSIGVPKTCVVAFPVRRNGYAVNGPALLRCGLYPL